MDRFTDSFLSEVKGDEALRHRLRAEVILGRSLLVKHLAGQHDQSSHGNWADGDGSKEISIEQLASIINANKPYDSLDVWRKTLQDVLKATGKTGKPTFGDTSQGMELWRSFEQGSAYDLETEDEISLSAEDKIKQFMASELPYISMGRNGIGLYGAHTKSEAVTWSRGNFGQIVKMALKPDAKILTIPSSDANVGFVLANADFLAPRIGLPNKTASLSDFKTSWFFTDKSSIVNLMALAMGYDAINFNPSIYYPNGALPDREIVVLNAGALIVQKPDTVKKHYLGQHDQSTHGNWAHGAVNDFAETTTFKNAVKKLAKTYADKIDTTSGQYGGSRSEDRLVQILHGDAFASSALGKQLQQQVKDAYPRDAVFLKTGGIFNNSFQGVINPNFVTGKDYPVVMYEALLRRVSDEVVKQATFAKFDASELLYQSFIADDLKALQKDGKVCQAMDEKSFTDLLKSDDPRFKTQFETGKSNGAYSKIGRMAGELRSQSMPMSEPVSKRPIYGYVAENDFDESILIDGPEQYGGIRVVFKDDVKTRTTMSVGDSLSTGCVPISMTQSEITPFDAWRASDRILYSTARDEGWNNDTYDIGYLNEGSYFESQIHDGVKLSDVEAIYIPSDSFDDISPLVPKGIRVVEY